MAGFKKGLFIVRFWLIILVTCSGVSSWAVDFPFVTHDQAKTIYLTEKKLQDYRLALGIYKKVRNRWQPEDGRRLKGKLRSQTLELPEDYSSAEAFSFYRRQLLPSQTSTLFLCEARDCGSSNA